MTNLELCSLWKLEKGKKKKTILNKSIDYSISHCCHIVIFSKYHCRYLVPMNTKNTMYRTYGQLINVQENTNYMKVYHINVGQNKRSQTK